MPRITINDTNIIRSIAQRIGKFLIGLDFKLFTEFYPWISHGVLL